MATSKRKNSLMAAIERANGGRPIRELLVDALNEKGTVKGAAETLGIHEKTAQKWIDAFGIQIKTVAA